MSAPKKLYWKFGDRPERVPLMYLALSISHKMVWRYHDSGLWGQEDALSLNVASVIEVLVIIDLSIIEFFFILS